MSFGRVGAGFDDQSEEALILSTLYKSGLEFDIDAGEEFYAGINGMDRESLFKKVKAYDVGGKEFDDKLSHLVSQGIVGVVMDHKTGDRLYTINNKHLGLAKAVYELAAKA